ncbi:unnamed protein product [Cercospora beticola]|nr:unnamed protein product [Cercospora beticola]
MAEIYRTAETVLACIGPADASSNAIYELYQHLDLHLDEIDSHDAFDHRALVRGPFWSQFEHPGQWDMLDGSELGRKMAEHWDNFSTRAYWSRLWIIQELHSARYNDRIEILCGDLTAIWDQLAKIASLFDEWGLIDSWYKGHKLFIREIDIMKSVYRRDAATARGHLEYFWDNLSHFSCEDPRDRVYGVLGIFPWNLVGIEKPLPDYEISCFDLALHLLSHTQVLSLGDTDGIVAALALDKLDIADLIQQFKASVTVTQPANSGSILYETSVTAACLIQQDCEGQLFVALDYIGAELDPAGEEEHLYAGCRRRFNSTNSLHDREHQPVQLLTENRLSVIAWHEATPGDILIRLGCCFIIIRPTERSTKFQVVGRVTCLYSSLTPISNKVKSWSCDCCPGARNVEARPNLRASFTGLSRAEALMLDIIKDTASNNALG